MKVVAWREDPDIRARLKIVETVYRQPVTRALEIVNRQLTNQGREAISLDQFYTDKGHCRDLFAESVPGGLSDHAAEILMDMAAVDRDLNLTPPGPSRAPLYAIKVRLREDLMKIDGTWGSQREAGGLELDHDSFGPSPQELLARGEIDHVEYRRFLVILAGSTQPARPTARRLPALPPPPDQVFEGEVRPAESETGAVRAQAAPGRRIRRGGTPTPDPPRAPGRGSQGDELPRVVEWDGAGEEFE